MGATNTNPIWDKTDNFLKHFCEKNHNLLNYLWASLWITLWITAVDAKFEQFKILLRIFFLFTIK